MEAVRDERLRDREPAGLEAPVGCEEPERARDDPGMTLLERDQAHRCRLRVAAEVDVVHGGVAEVPAAVRALARAQEPDRLAPRGGIVRRQGVHGEQHAGCGLGERAGVGGPAPGRPPVRVRRVGKREAAVGNRVGERAAGVPPVGEREGAERRARRAVVAPVLLLEAAVGPEPRGQPRARGSIVEGERRDRGGLDLRDALDAHRQTAVGSAKLGERADERCMEAGGAHHATWCPRGSLSNSQRGVASGPSKVWPGTRPSTGTDVAPEADDSRYSPERGGNGDRA